MIRRHSLSAIHLFRKTLALVLAVLVVVEPATAFTLTPARPAAPPPALHIIQDIHAHAEAQRSIAQILGRLRDAHHGRLRVGLEGAAGPLDFKAYRAFPDDHIRRNVSMEMLDAGRIAGPILSGLCDNGFDIVGIETPALYVANVAAYRRALPLQKSAQQAAAREREKIDGEKRARFTPELLRFDAAVEAYRSGKSGLGEYLEQLSARSDAGLAVEAFLAAHRMEKSIDFARVEAEKHALVERLAGAFTEKEAEAARRWVADALADDRGASKRFEFLFHAATGKGIDLRSYPALSSYVQYLRLAESIDTDRVFADAESMEESAYRGLCARAPGSAEIVAASRRLHLVEKLLRFELTHADWRAYENARPAGAPLPSVDLAPFEDFYRIAAQRDAALINNARSAAVDAVVVGGFHTEGLTRALEKSGVAVDVVRPKITSASAVDATAYLTV
ncbi:MAG: hypothetical protein JO102_03905, partial [Elusimicrobia bacterium]|nr:hypothetical protein [Elusimicrobiota bacterium]